MYLFDKIINFNIILLIIIKCYNWFYESEICVFINMGKIILEIFWLSVLLNGKDKSLRNLRFNLKNFKGVIFGYNCSIWNRNNIWRILRENNNIEYDLLLFVEVKVNLYFG